MIDENGYPTKEALDKLSTISMVQDHKGMLEFVRSLWYYPEYATLGEDGKTYTFRTAGWSGNEALIEALRENILFWTFCWQMSKKGGVHVFVVKDLPQVAKESLEAQP